MFTLNTAALFRRAPALTATVMYLLAHAPAARAYQHGRALGPIESLAVLRIFSAAPGTPTPDPFVIMVQVTNVRCGAVCSFVNAERTESIVPPLPTAALTAIVAPYVVPAPAPEGGFVIDKISCTLNITSQTARCWLITN